VTGEYHVPVMGGQAIDLLMTTPDGVYVDCTVGGGGHSRLILERLSPRGTLIACDRDPDAIEHARTTLPSSVQLHPLPFSKISQHLRDHVSRGVSGVLFDLGVSSYQLDEASRGFSHRFAAPLDLRMDPTAGETAAELIARLDQKELIKMIRELGEDPQAARIARAIMRERDTAPIQSTDQLSRIISEAVPATRNKSLARVFQALRMTVNNELAELAAGLQGAWSLLSSGGRLVVISYHSLEDRAAKEFMRDKAHPASDPRLPFAEEPAPSGRLLARKPLSPSPEELQSNPRSRSAKLRGIEKIS
jgi:16S rRNA (cytosine1402-N4)-methyltransferase